MNNIKTMGSILFSWSILVLQLVAVDFVIERNVPDLGQLFEWVRFCVTEILLAFTLQRRRFEKLFNDISSMSAPST